MIPSVRPGGFGPKIWGVNGDEEYVGTGIDQDQAMMWAERRAMQDAMDAEQAADQEAARQADTDAGFKAVGMLGKAAVKHTEWGRQAQDWVAGMLGRPVRTPITAQRWGLGPKAKLLDHGESYRVDKPFNAIQQKGAGGRYTGPSPRDVNFGTNPPRASPPAGAGGRYTSPSPGAGGRMMVPQGAMPQAPAPAPSISDIAAMTKPATSETLSGLSGATAAPVGISGATAAPVGAGAGAAAPGLLDTAGNFIGNLAGGVAIGAGGYQLATNGLNRATLPAGRGQANRARAVGGVSAYAGAVAGAKVGASVGTYIAPGVGTVVGGVIGGVVGAIPGLSGLFGKRGHKKRESYWDWRWY